MNRSGLSTVFLSLICIFSTTAATPQSEQIEKGKYLRIVQHHADVLLTFGRDSRGPKQTPLFVDAISPQTLKPYVWRIDPDEMVVKQFEQPEQQIMANFLFMQGILDMLRELTKLTGDAKYKEAASECAAYSLEHATSPCGLIHWGKHATYDTLSDKPLGHPGTPNIHYFTGGGFASWQFLYAIRPQAVNRHIEQQWNTTLDSPSKWRRLEWGLHPQYNRPFAIPWRNLEKIEEDTPVPFPTEYKMYPQIAFELLYAARTYSQQGNNDPRSRAIWLTLLKRFEDSRDSQTGLWPVMYSYSANPKSPKKWFGGSVRDTLGLPFFAKMAELSHHDQDGARFLEFTLKDLKAYRRYKHVPGTDRCYSDATISGKHSDKTEMVSDSVLWAFALVYRMTGEELLWDTIRDFCKGRRFGDIGESDGSGSALKFNDVPNLHIDPVGENNISAGFLVHTFVELYKRTKLDHGEAAARPYLAFAAKLADTIIEQTYINGVFTRGRKANWARTASLTPMALLHLEATMRGIELEPESVIFRRWGYRFTRTSDRLPGDNGHDWGIYSARESKSE